MIDKRAVIVSLECSTSNLMLIDAKFVNGEVDDIGGTGGSSMTAVYCGAIINTQYLVSGGSNYISLSEILPIDRYSRAANPKL